MTLEHPDGIATTKIPVVSPLGSEQIGPLVVAEGNSHYWSPGATGLEAATGQLIDLQYRHGSVRDFSISTIMSLNDKKKNKKNSKILLLIKKKCQG